MIELGQEVFRAAHTPFDRGDLNPDDFVAQLLATVAEARQRGLDVSDLLAPIITPAETTISGPRGTEQQEKLADIKNALADKFTTPDRLLLPEDFSVITGAKKVGAAVLHVILTAPSGIYRGSYEAIMADEPENTAAYTIEIDGQEFDARKAMTRRVHRAMSVQALGKYLANSSKNMPTNASDSGTRIATWYTGDNLNNLQQAPFGYDDDIYPDRHWWRPSSDSPSVLVRPGIEVTSDMLGSTT